MKKIKIPKLQIKSQSRIDEEIANLDDLSSVAEKEVGENLKNIKEYEKKLKDRWDFEGDAGYYFSVCFKSQKERDDFLRKTGLQLRGDFVFYEEIQHLLNVKED